ncbi:hypothetical protein [Ekhidna sp.]|uniref:hypothetical protein n=1 Tax=Ekhidna sp. TaxID=2608089 RepID=UPI0032EC7CD2
METLLENIVFAIMFFGGIILTIYIIARYTYLTKKALADRGFNPQDQKFKVTLIDLACIVIAGGVGLGLASFLTLLNISEDMMDMLIYGFLLVFIGVGLFAANHFRNKD